MSDNLYSATILFKGKLSSKRTSRLPRLGPVQVRHAVGHHHGSVVTIAAATSEEVRAVAAAHFPEKVASLSVRSHPGVALSLRLQAEIREATFAVMRFLDFIECRPQWRGNAFVHDFTKRGEIAAVVKGLDMYVARLGYLHKNNTGFAHKGGTYRHRAGCMLDVTRTGVVGVLTSELLTVTFTNESRAEDDYIDFDLLK